MDGDTPPAEPTRWRTRPPAERARRRDLQSDGIMLIVATTIIVASTILTPSESVITLLGWEIPPLCMWKNLTGMDCIGCGMTRSFTYMGHLDPVAAFDRHIIGPALYALVAAQIPFRGWRMWRTYKAGPSTVRG